MAITPHQQKLLDILDAPHGDLYDKDAILAKIISTPYYSIVKAVFAKADPLINSNENSYQELYFCDPRKNTECKKTNCYWDGGPCNITTKIEFSLSGETEESKTEEDN